VFSQRLHDGWMRREPWDTCWNTPTAWLDTRTRCERRAHIFWSTSRCGFKRVSHRLVFEVHRLKVSVIPLHVALVLQQVTHLLSALNFQIDRRRSHRTRVWNLIHALSQLLLSNLTVELNDVLDVRRHHPLLLCGLH
jgi:hypothetical protein